MLDGLQEDRRSVGPAGLAAGVPRLGLSRLVLTDFRNYRSARLDFAPMRRQPAVVLTGANGAGKTNLLEALSFLSPGRGLRNARLGDIERRSSDGEHVSNGWAVAATIETRQGTVRIGTGREAAESVGLQPAGATRGERRVIRIDGEPVRGQAALAERFGVLWLTPPMDRLFVEGPGGRRRLMDRLVLGLDPAHAARVARYDHALRERSHLLRAMAQGGPGDPAWLAALEEIMAAEGVALAAARRDAVERLDRECAAAGGAFPRARLSLVGTVEAWLDAMPALAAEEKFREALRRNRPSDAPLGGAELGPHRSDLAVMHAEKGIAAESASTGEQKALLISMLLAQARLQQALRGEPPLLLLDEVSAHLDAARRAALLDVLAEFDSQAWLTGTDMALFAPLRGAARFVTVADGVLSDTGC